MLTRRVYPPIHASRRRLLLPAGPHRLEPGGHPLLRTRLAGLAPQLSSTMPCRQPGCRAMRKQPGKLARAAPRIGRLPSLGCRTSGPAPFSTQQRSAGLRQRTHPEAQQSRSGTHFHSNATSCYTLAIQCHCMLHTSIPMPLPAALAEVVVSRMDDRHIHGMLCEWRCVTHLFSTWHAV